MKVGILTFHCSYNFGANLQALALQSVLQKKGVDCVVVDYRDPHKMEWYEEHTPPEQSAAHKSYLNKYLRLGPLLTKPQEVENYCQEALDAVLVGSDAVFRLPAKYSPRDLIRAYLGRGRSLTNPEERNRLSAYWLDWPNHPAKRRVGKATIAASAEASSFYFASPRLFPALYHCIRGFDFLSVRDGWTSTMVRTLSLGTRKAEFGPDPVFALNSAFEVAREEQPPCSVSDVILLSGNFGPKWTERFVAAAHARGRRVANLPNPDRTFEFSQADFAIKLPLSPLQWFRLLATAAGFIGIRFHALVSCITNRTPAIALDSPGLFEFNYKLRSKVYDLCCRAGIPERYSHTKTVPLTDPEVLLSRLESRESQRRADDYAQFAEFRFQEIVDRALRAVA